MKTITTLPRMRTVLLATIFMAVAVYVSDVHGSLGLLDTLEDVLDNTLGSLPNLKMFRRYMNKHKHKFEKQKLMEVIKYNKSILPWDNVHSAEENHATETGDEGAAIPENTGDEEHNSQGRQRRSVRYWDEKTWGYDIPYVIDSSFSSQNGGFYVPILKRVLKWISGRVCVTFHDETLNVNQSMISLGYPHEAYLFVNYNGASCSAYLHVNGKTGPVGIKPCLGFRIELHEFLHALGSPHMQEMPGRESFMSINPGNIEDGSLRTYSENPDTEYFALNFDSTSVMLYRKSSSTLNGMETYYLMRDEDEMETDGISAEETTFRELNEVYQCNAMFCGNQTVDCGFGYFALREGVCRCVCPRFYDPDTNCQTLINQANNAAWPDVPLVLFKGGANTPCPDGLDEFGEFSHTGKWPDLQNPLPDTFAVSGDTTYFQTCGKSGPSPVDWEKMPPGGSYCIIKPVGVPCGFGQATTLEFTSLSSVTYSGNIGDTVITGLNITTKYCCSFQAHTQMVIRLPNGVPFRLIAKGVCPTIEGMRDYKAIVNYFTPLKAVLGGVLPQFYIFTNELQTFHCFYQPPVYGCSQEITLDATTSSVTITTPGYNESAREPDRRCFYIFHAPAGAKLTLTLEDYDLHVDDKLLIQTYNVWQTQKIVDNTKPFYQMTSWENFLSLEFWAGWTTVTNKGVKFSVQVHLADDFCYDASTNGANYFGEKSIAEGDMECIPWSKAVTCDLFPWTYDMLVDIAEGNAHCRNPHGDLHGPWCYTYVNGVDCQKKYCDACNYWEPHDRLGSTLCSQLIAADPDFCNSATQRFSCFQSCNFQQPTYVPSTCGTPSTPPNATPLEALKSSYVEGETVTFQCAQSSLLTSDSITCRKNGWTDMNYLCQACPPDWVTYKDICYKFMVEQKVDGVDAEPLCNAAAPTGTLFRVTSAEDQEMLEEYRDLMRSPYYKAIWISGTLKATIANEAIGDWEFTGNDNVAMTYHNWKPDQDPNNMDKPCVRLSESWLTDGNMWKAETCGGGTYDGYTLCQQNQIDIGCEDKDSNCEAVLAKFPDFCSDVGAVELAEARCRRSCGYCESNTCTEPLSLEYSRTSSNMTIYPGEVMTFECAIGRYHVGGDLKRACASSGQLLGEEPDCSLTPVTTDVNRHIRARSDEAGRKWAYLLDQEGYRVPFNGNITKWYYQCHKEGSVYALVYRHIGMDYNYIGSNILSCLSQLPWSHSVPSADQISVQQNDIVGFYSEDKDTIYLNECDGEIQQILNATIAYGDNFNELMSQTFSSTECIVPSFGFQVTP